MFRSSDNHHQGAFWYWLKCESSSVVMRQHTVIRFACCIVQRGMSTCRPESSLMMIIWWSKHVGVILNVLVCDVWINVLIQTSALVWPLYIARCSCFVTKSAFTMNELGSLWGMKYNNLSWPTDTRFYREQKRLDRSLGREYVMFLRQYMEKHFFFVGTKFWQKVFL
jgi:hypothetical protein